MKKLMLCIVAIATLSSQSIFAQDVPSGKGIYFKVNGGYNFAISNSQHSMYETPILVASSTPFWNITETIGDDQYEVIDVNLGKGLNFGGTFGYMFNDRFGAELEVDYLIGSKTEAKHRETSGEETIQKLYSKMIQIKPAFVLSAGYSKVNPYAKFGAIIGSGKIFEEYTNTGGGSTYEAKAEAKGGIAFGFHAGLGINFGLTSNLSLFGELNMNNLSYAPEKGKLTKFTENGVDQMSTLDINEREYEYSDNPNLNSSNPNQPSQGPKTSYNFGTLGINIGLKYSL